MNSGQYQLLVNYQTKSAILPLLKLNQRIPEDNGRIMKYLAFTANDLSTIVRQQRAISSLSVRLQNSINSQSIDTELIPLTTLKLIEVFLRQNDAKSKNLLAAPDLSFT